MYVTEHAKRRLKERNGLNSKSIDRIAERALNEGIRHNQTKSRLCKWVTSVFFRNTSINNIRLYGDKAYLFVDEKLVTVLQIPQSLTKDMRKMIKE